MWLKLIWPIISPEVILFTAAEFWQKCAKSSIKKAKENSPFLFTYSFLSINKHKIIRNQLVIQMIHKIL